MGNDPKTIGPKLSTTGNGVQSAPTIIGTKLSTRESEVQEVFHRMLVGAMRDSLLNLKTRVSAIILLAQTMLTTVNVKSIELLAQEPNANSIEVRSTKQK